MTYKDALIEVIMSSKNNPYKTNELKSFDLSVVKDIHDEIMLSKKMITRKY